MGDIVSLKLVRKRKERAEREDEASRNRAAFGRSKAEKEMTKASEKKARGDLDGHRREE